MNISSFFYNTDFLDEGKCRRAILEMLNPNGPACKHCGEKLPEERHERWFENKHNFCSKCHRKFFGTTGTPFNSLKISFATAVMIRFLFEQGYRPNQIKRRLKLNGETIRVTRRRFELLEALCD